MLGRLFVRLLSSAMNEDIHLLNKSDSFYGAIVQFFFGARIVWVVREPVLNFCLFSVI